MVEKRMPEVSAKDNDHYHNSMQARANRLHWETLGEKPSFKRRVFQEALIEVHNEAVEDAAFEIKGAPQSDIDAILRLRIEVPE